MSSLEAASSLPDSPASSMTLNSGRSFVPVGDDAQEDRDPQYAEEELGRRPWTPGREASSSPGPETAQDIHRSKTRKGAGFLLPSAFRRSTEAKRASQDVHSPSRTSKGKEKATNGHAVQATANDATGSDRRNSSESRNHATGNSGLSKEVFPAPSGFSGSGSTEMASEHDEFQDESRTAALDASQIVNMALNLSEGRRRHMSGSHLIPPQQPTSGRRVLSSGIPSLQGNYGPGVGGSLRQHLQQQRVSSRNAPLSDRRSPGSRLASTTYANGAAVETGQEAELVYPYRFTAATLARAEKAKAFIELSVEFRRSLQFLPKLGSKSPSHHARHHSLTRADTTESSADNGKPSQLGRSYNPLQVIRNRKARARARAQLDPDVNFWEDPSAVKLWVDAVEHSSQGEHYKHGERVLLPQYPVGDITIKIPLSKDGRTVPSRRMDWSMNPSEFLADAYWLEQGTNKALIEDAHGNKIFPTLLSADQARGRASIESHRSKAGSVGRSSHSRDSFERDIEVDDSIERGREDTMQHHHHGRNDSTGRFKHVWHKARGRSRSSASDLSHSDEDLGQAQKISVPTASSHENLRLPDRISTTGLTVEPTGFLHASPDLISPGTPNKWGSDPPTTARKTLLEENGSVIRSIEPIQPPGSRSQPAAALMHPQTPKMRRSSLEGPGSSSPTSPVIVPFIPSFAADLSPPSSRKPSPSRRMRGKIPFVKGEGPKEIKSAEQRQATYAEPEATPRESEDHIPRQSLDGLASPVRMKGIFSQKTNDSISSLSARPPSRGREGREAKEADSAVRRFFKGRRLGEIVRGEAKVGSFIRKKDSSHEYDVETPLSDSTSSMDESDTDETSGTSSARDILNGRRLKRKNTNGSMSRRQHSHRYRSNKPDKSRYHIELPTFKPTSTPPTSQPPTPGRDHISEQQKQLTQQRSPRLDRLLPDLSRISTGETSKGGGKDLSRVSTLSTIGDTSPDDHRKKKHGRHGLPHFLHPHSVRSHSGLSKASKHLAAALDIPGMQGRIGLPPSALSSLAPNVEGSGPGEQRHWSISDNISTHSPHPGASTISAKDVARVRALLLCTGIKAAELARRAYEPRSDGAVPPYLLQAIESSGAELAELETVPRKDEPMHASRLLGASLHSDSVQLHDSASQFRSETVAQLRSGLSELHGNVSSCLELARNTADAAVGFGALVTGQKTIEVRRVLDAAEKFRRQRRRRMRWVRRVGFGLLEWGVLLFMWWVWLIVMIFKTCWGVIRGVGRAVRWALWL
jgi:hypothetical protein